VVNIVDQSNDEFRVCNLVNVSMILHVGRLAAKYTVLIASLIASGQAVLAQDLHGSVAKEGAVGSVDASSTAKAKSSTTTLQGGVKDDATLNSSLRLFPLSTDHTRLNVPVNKNSVSPFPQDAQLDQYAGSTHLTPGNSALGINYDTTRATVIRSGVMPPISSYTFAPRNSVIWSAPGFAVLPPSSVTESTYHSSSYNTDPTPVSHGGVTSYLPGFEVNTVSSYRVPIAGPHTGSGSGLTLWAPGYEIEKVSTTVTPPMVVHDLNQTSVDGQTTVSSGYQSYRSVSRNGVVCWAPGYEISIEFPGMVKNSLGGVWSTTNTVNELHARPGKLPPVRGGENAQVVAVPTPLVASSHLLPGLHVLSEAPNWKQWYSSFADNALSRWHSVDVGPGVAKVRVVVARNRDVSCSVIDFTAVAERNANAETEFRETAVRCVSSINKFEIPQFPAGSDLQEVTFDLDMKRLVDGPSGISVATQK